MNGDSSQWIKSKFIKQFTVINHFNSCFFFETLSLPSMPNNIRRAQKSELKNSIYSMFHMSMNKWFYFYDGWWRIIMITFRMKCFFWALFPSNWKHSDKYNEQRTKHRQQNEIIVLWVMSENTITAINYANGSSNLICTRNVR